MNELFAKLQQVSLGKSVIIGVIIAAAYWFLSDDGSVYQASVNTKTKQLQDIRGQIAKVEESVRLAQQYQVTVAALGNQLSTLSSYIPEQFDNADLMRIVSTEAKAAGLDILRITEARNDQMQNSDLYQEFDIKVDLQGSYPQHVLFLSFLTKLKTIVTVRDFTMEAVTQRNNTGSDVTEAKLSLTLVGYRYAANQKGAK